MKKYFSNTPLASWIKVFTTVIFSEVVSSIVTKHNIFSWDLSMWENIISSALLSMLPVICNYLNPNDPRYGIKAKNDTTDILREIEDNINNKKQILGKEGFVGPVPPNPPYPPPPPPPTQGGVNAN